jgi:NADH-quinone oxidoreductase subunit E
VRISTRLGLKPGQTDSGLQFTLETVHCLGCCALAPVVRIDGEYYHDPSRKKFDTVIKSLTKEEGQACRA